MVFHAVAKNILFLCAGAIIYKTHKTYVSELKGIGKEMPIVMWTFALAALSLIGIPPTSGFVSKWYLAQGGLLPQAGMLVCRRSGADGQRTADGRLFDEYCSEWVLPRARILIIHPCREGAELFG